MSRLTEQLIVRACLAALVGVVVFVAYSVEVADDTPRVVSVKMTRGDEG